MSSSWNLRPKFVSAYEKLFQSSPTQLTALDQDEFWLDVFALDVDAPWLSQKLRNLSQEDCLGSYKKILNLLCRRSLLHLSTASYEHPVKFNALETLMAFVYHVLGKQLSGWEIMDVFAGGVSESDKLFSTLTLTIDVILGDEQAPSKQIFTIFYPKGESSPNADGFRVNQLSPGAYFLRKDLYPSLNSMILSPKTQQFTFEATLLLSLLSNFHKSDAARSNPYFNKIKESDDEKLMTNISWVLTYALQKATSTYQEILDDSPPSLATSFGSLVASLRPDRALSAVPVDLPRELFKNQPIEAAVVLLPLYDLLHYNRVFRKTFGESLSRPVDETTTTPSKLFLPQAMISLSSYILTHASSTSSLRTLAYAHLTLISLLVWVEDRDMITDLCQTPSPKCPEIRLCRQRAPQLPLSLSPRPPICALLDCCVLWLRHNLHKRLEILSYLTCIRVVHRVIWFVATEKLRLDYHWEELWRALTLVLDFVANQIGTLKSVAKVDDLIKEIICTLDFATHFAERFLPTPQALHQMVYELVRSASTFAKQTELLKSLDLPTNMRSSSSSHGMLELANLERISDHYQKKLIESKAQSARAVMKLLAQSIDQEGIYGTTEEKPLEELLSRYSDDIVDSSFIRWACADGLALMEV